jgi:hypothetical protein
MNFKKYTGKDNTYHLITINEERLDCHNALSIRNELVYNLDNGFGKKLNGENIILNVENLNSMDSSGKTVIDIFGELFFNLGYSHPYLVLKKNGNPETLLNLQELLNIPKKENRFNIVHSLEEI